MSTGNRRKRIKARTLRGIDSAERRGNPTSVADRKNLGPVQVRKSPAKKVDDGATENHRSSHPVGNTPTIQIVNKGGASNVAIAVFTGVLTALSAIQVWTFLKSESAAIDIEALGFANNGPTAGQRVEILLDIRNTGDLTAQVVNFSINLKLSDLPEEPQYITESNGAFGFIPAGGFRRTTNLPKHGPGYLALPQTVIDELNRGSRKMYVYGFIAYKDQFGLLTGTRTTGYCFEYIPNSAGTGLRFQSCVQRAYIYNN